MELKQATFGTPEKKPVKKKPKGIGKAQSTYWVCIKGHIFEHKHYTHPDRINKLECPICRQPIKNKSSKNSYLYYLKTTGRVDEKTYRSDQIRKKKLLERKGTETELEPREENV